MKQLLTSALLFLTLSGCGSSEKSKVEQVATSQSPLDTIVCSKCESAASVGRIPASVRTALFNLMKYDPRLADRDKRFNATDVVDDRFPSRRLVFAGGTSTAWFVYYEHGGIGYHRHLVIFALKSDLAKCVYSCQVQPDVKNVSQLKHAISKGLVSCEPCEAAYEF